MKHQTQRGEILKYLKTHKRGLTQKEATEKFGSERLAAHICVFRKRGYDIETVDEYGKDRYGNTSRWARYIFRA